MYFLVIKLTSCRGDLSDISDKSATLLRMVAQSKTHRVGPKRHQCSRSIYIVSGLHTWMCRINSTNVSGSCSDTHFASIITYNRRNGESYQKHDVHANANTLCLLLSPLLLTLPIHWPHLHNSTDGQTNPRLDISKMNICQGDMTRGRKIWQDSSNVNTCNAKECQVRSKLAGNTKLSDCPDAHE